MSRAENEITKFIKKKTCGRINHILLEQRAFTHLVDGEGGVEIPLFHPGSVMITQVDSTTFSKL